MGRLSTTECTYLPTYLTTNCGKPSSLSWTSARVGPADQGISGIEVST